MKIYMLYSEDANSRRKQVTFGNISVKNEPSDI
jgi:hypothetical protein